MLVADDESFNLIVYEGLFEQFEVSVAKVMSGEECIEAVLKNHSPPCDNHAPYKLITLDNQMLTMNGYDTACILRKY